LCMTMWPLISGLLKIEVEKVGTRYEHKIFHGG